MKSVARTIGIMGLLALLVPALAQATLQVERSEEYGQYLVDREGQPLYLFTADDRSAVASTCYDRCAEAWPPYVIEGEAQAGDGVDPQMLGTFERDTGETQVTYSGWPLYHFVKDEGAEAPQGHNVEGFGGVWYLASAQGIPVGTEGEDAEGQDSEAQADEGQNAEDQDGRDQQAGQEQDQQEVTAEIIDADGTQVGTATLSQVSVDGTQAVRVSVELNEFTQAQAGMHGIHLHAVGECEPPNFSSAGSHFSPVGNNHGYLSQGGPHAGDLPNIQIDEQGNASYEWVTDLVSLSEGERALSDADGAAIVIHAQQDDYRSDPGGSSGPMIACGVIYQAGE